VSKLSCNVSDVWCENARDAKVADSNCDAGTKPGTSCTGGTCKTAHIVCAYEEGVFHAYPRKTGPEQMIIMSR